MKWCLTLHMQCDMIKIQSSISACNKTSANHTATNIRGCTGFDGDLEIEEAIRGPGPRSKPDNKYKRRRTVSVRSLMAAVGLR